MIAKIDKGVAASAVKRTLDTLYDSMENDKKAKTEEEIQNLTTSINRYEDILKKLNNKIILNTEDYNLLFLSLGTNASLLELKSDQMLAAAAGLRKYADNIKDYLLYMERQTVLTEPQEQIILEQLDNN